MRKLYNKNPVSFALVWIGLYVVMMNVALQFCGGLDNLADKAPSQVLIPVLCSLALGAASTVWIIRNGLQEQFGLCSFRGGMKAFLWFIPLILTSCVNLVNGLTLNAPLAVSLLMMLNMAAAGYVEEIIFRGFLFRGMAKSGLKSAIIVSAVTFGAGHIVNLGNTADKTGVLLQVCYAIAIGFMFTLVVLKGGSLWPCIVSHMVVNGTSVFAAPEGPLTSLLTTLFGNGAAAMEPVLTAALLIILSGGYALWLWKRA